MRRLLAVAILGVSLAASTSAAMAHDSAGIPQRSWDGVQTAGQTFMVSQFSGGALSVVAGAGIDDGYNPYRPSDSKH